MKLEWQQKDFKDDMDFILFHQKDGTPQWWNKQLFNVYPDLDYKYAQSLSESARFEYLNSQMKVLAKNKQPVIDSSIKTFQETWNALMADKLNVAYSSAFGNDCSDVLNDMSAYVGLNPICPRDLEHHCFDVFFYFETQYAMSVALHEITHLVWFYFWQKHFHDNTSEYDFPYLKWLLSEIVVETIIRNSDISTLIAPPQYIAYSYFYDITINGELIFDMMKRLYVNRKDIYDFMEQSYEWIQRNEPELRLKIAQAEK